MERVTVKVDDLLSALAENLGSHKEDFTSNSRSYGA